MYDDMYLPVENVLVNVAEVALFLIKKGRTVN